MAYNNGYPVTYPQMYYQNPYPTTAAMPQPVQQTVTQPVPVPQSPAPQPMNSSIVWVQGEGAARSFLMAPNTTLPLWDSESNTIYIKTTDAAGMPSMKVLDYTIRGAESTTANGNNVLANNNATASYADKAEQDALKALVVTYKEEIDALRSEMEVFKGDLYGIAGKKNTTTKRKEVVADE